MKREHGGPGQLADQRIESVREELARLGDRGSRRWRPPAG